MLRQQASDQPQMGSALPGQCSSCEHLQVLYEGIVVYGRHAQTCRFSDKASFLLSEYALSFFSILHIEPLLFASSHGLCLMSKRKQLTQQLVETTKPDNEPAFLAGNCCLCLSLLFSDCLLAETCRDENQA